MEEKKEQKKGGFISFNINEIWERAVTECMYENIWESKLKESSGKENLQTED